MQTKAGNVSVRGLCFAVLAFLIIPNGFFNMYLRGEEIPNTPDEGEIKPQYTDPKTLTNIYFKASEYRKSRGTQIKSENWFKHPGNLSKYPNNLYRPPDYWYCNDVGDWTIIKNGKDALALDQENMTAKIVTPKNYPNIDYDYKDVIGLVELGLSLISGKEPKSNFSDHNFAGRYHKYKHAPEKSTEDTVVYYTYHGGKQPGEIYIDAETGLVKKMILVRSSGGSRIEYLFDYSEIPLEKFSLDIPEGYKEVTDRLLPFIQGGIFDNELKPVENADIYILGRRIKIHSHGKSDANGQFVLDAFFSPQKPRFFEYPIFVYAVSDDHPDQTAWTIILHPDSKNELPAVVPYSGAVVAKGDGSPPNGDCVGISGMTLVFEPAVEVCGRITNVEDGTPVANAEIQLEVDGHYGDLFQGLSGYTYKKYIRRNVKTDADGYYFFESIPNFAWPEESIAHALEVSKQRLRSGIGKNFVGIKATAYADGYNEAFKRIALLPGDVLEGKKFDIALTPKHDVTVRGVVLA